MSFFSILRKGAFFTFLTFFYKSVFNTSKTTYQGILSIKKMIFKNYQKFCLKCVFLEILICDFSAVLAWGHTFLLQNWFLLRPQVARSAQFGWSVWSQAKTTEKCPDSFLEWNRVLKSSIQHAHADKKNLAKSCYLPM